VAQDNESSAGTDQQISQFRSKSTYYALLDVQPMASAQEIRRAYRELSKLYHPDTTQLPQAIATARFQVLNEAYGTLSNPERRLQYDLKVGYSHYTVVQPPADLHTPVSGTRLSSYSSSAYLDPNDRPLSAGEIFAVFILALTFIACLVLAVAIGLTDSQANFQTMRTPTPIQQGTAPDGGDSIAPLSTKPDR
jgi:hypothetical protein